MIAARRYPESGSRRIPPGWVERRHDEFAAVALSSTGRRHRAPPQNRRRAITLRDLEPFDKNARAPPGLKEQAFAQSRESPYRDGYQVPALSTRTAVSIAITAMHPAVALRMAAHVNDL